MADTVGASELVADFEEWTARAREWLPCGAGSVPVADLMTFLDAAQTAMGNLSEGALYLVWRQWGTCLRALADNPLVMLSAAGDTILSSTLHVLHRAHLTHSDDARCREECQLLEDWCAAFVRHLAGGPTHQPSGIDHALAEVGADAERCALHRTLELTEQVVTALRAERRPADEQGPARAGGPARIGAAPSDLAWLVSEIAIPLLHEPAASTLINELCRQPHRVSPAFACAVNTLWSQDPAGVPLSSVALASLWLRSPLALWEQVEQRTYIVLTSYLHRTYIVLTPYLHRAYTVLTPCLHRTYIVLTS